MTVESDRLAVRSPANGNCWMQFSTGANQKVQVRAVNSTLRVIRRMRPLKSADDAVILANCKSSWRLATARWRWKRLSEWGGEDYHRRRAALGFVGQV